MKGCGCSYALLSREDLYLVLLLVLLLAFLELFISRPSLYIYTCIQHTIYKPICTTPLLSTMYATLPVSRPLCRIQCLPVQQYPGKICRSYMHTYSLVQTSVNTYNMYTTHGFVYYLETHPLVIWTGRVIFFWMDKNIRSQKHILSCSQLYF